MLRAQFTSDGQIVAAGADQTSLTASGLSVQRHGQRLVAVGRDRTVKIWQRQVNGLFAARPNRVLTGHRAKVTSVAISPDGALIATGSADKTISLWRNYQWVATLTGHHAEIKTLTFSPDGRWLASGSADNTITLWQSDGTRVNTLTSHSAAITSLAFSPDSQLLASASVDSTVKIWQPDHPNPLLRTLTGHQGHLSSVAFSLDGRLIASAGVDRKITLWHIDEILQVNELDYACHWLGDYLQHHPEVAAADRQLCAK